MIPLDDLLPTSDAAFEPVDSGEYFDSASPFWEFSDRHKWLAPAARSEKETFRFGYYAAMFECLLKSGKAFRFPVDRLPVHVFEKRASDYGRTVKHLVKESVILEIVVSEYK